MSWRNPKIVWLVLFITLAAGCGLALWKIPQMQLSSVSYLSPKERIELENTVRLTLTQILGGAFVIAGVYLTWRNIAILEDKRITELLSQSIKHLGDSETQIRLGGIYSLERISKDSKKDHWQIIEILSAYVRNKAKWDINNDSFEQLKPVSIDIQAILTVISRRDWTQGHTETSNIDLQATNLKQGNLSRADLKKINMSNACLEKAVLKLANLHDADLQRSIMRNADLYGADLSSASLEEANFYCAILIGANLEEANLTKANLALAKLADSNLENAILRGANLSGADLSRANLSGVNFTDTNLKGANIEDAMGLTKQQLDQAYKDPNTKLPKYLVEN